LLREHDLAGTVPSLLHNLGCVALRRNDARRALRLFRESLALFRDQGDRRGVADCLEGVAGAFGALRQPERAARLFGAAERLREATGSPAWPANASDVARGIDSVRQALDPVAFARAWGDGRRWAVEQAVSQALAAERLDRGADDELTPREREVALLVAQGRTNRQIGERLVITEGTARLHVKHVLGKLGFQSRAQIAAWVAARGIDPAGEPDIPPPDATYPLRGTGRLRERL
jgi:non-specific serine/threonine protein kinase